MAKKNAKERVVSLLAYEKKISPSDGYFYGTTWENRHETRSALYVREKSVRGTISNSLKDTIDNDPMKTSAEINLANLQTVDSCFLPSDNDTLVVSFTVKFFGGLDKNVSCNNPEFLEKYKSTLDTYKKEFGFKELAFRYAYNIACARFLWRNRIGAEEIEVIVRDCRSGKTWTFDARSFNLRNFSPEKKAELQSLSEKIADTFMGNDFALFEVEGFAKIGNGQEVYPSEELILDKPKEKKSGSGKSKILYTSNNMAAFHSQKIGNAIRTIDTWYPAYSTPEGVGPIAIDSYAAVTALSRVFRVSNGSDFYTVKNEYIWDGEPRRPEDKHFFMAMIIRGGVFSESS